MFNHLCEFDVQNDTRIKFMNIVPFTITVFSDTIHKIKCDEEKSK